MVTKSFEETLHPRGADGRFIEKFGIIKFLKNAKWQYGKVSDITQDDHGNVSVKVDESDLSGNVTGMTHVLQPNQIYQAPKPASYLKIDQPGAKKVGGQAGSNPGGMYELPTAEPTAAALSPMAEAIGALYADTAAFKEGLLKYNGAGVPYLEKSKIIDNNKVTVRITDPGIANEVRIWVQGDKGPKDGAPFTSLDAAKAFFGGPVSTAPKTNKWYVKKAKSKQHGRNEDLANALYRALGVPVPDVAFDEKDGNIYSKIVDGAVEDMGSQLKNPAWTDQIKANFAIDAWLGNWDVFGMTWDNIKTAPDGVPYRIDNGGALLYRAQGAAKGKDFGASVPELDSFKTGKKAQVFGGITKEQELDGAQRILALRPEDIWLMVAQHNLPDSLGDTLIARRAYIAKHYGLDLPEEIEAAAIPVDTVDLTTSGGKPRHWKSAPLSTLMGILSTGDQVEIDGEPFTFGTMPGMPVGTSSKNIQMSMWLSEYGPDQEVWFSKGVSDKPRPPHGASMKLADLGGYEWERGDKIVMAGIGTKMEVVSVNSQTGMAVLLPEGKTTPLLWSLRYDGHSDVKVETWDKKEPLPEPGVEEPLQEWELQLLAPMEPEPTPTVEELQTLLEPVSTGPVTQATAATAAIKTDIQVEAQKNVTAGPGTKTMFLGDGTEASPGSKVFSSKDGKTYIYVKKKGPYAVVTDPDSDDPAKPLLKLASTLGQPDKTPTAIPEAGAKTKPTSANGVTPMVGMTATAKDGHTGVIINVAPDGKFVWIQDSTGKKKRKSIGTVTIDSKESAAAAVTLPEPDVSTNDQGQTVISIPDPDPDPVQDVDTVKALYPEAASWWPTPVDWDAGDKWWGAKIEPDGSFGMVPVIKGETPPEGFIPLSSGGGIAGYDITDNILPVAPSVLVKAASNAQSNEQYKVLLDGSEWWSVHPNPAYSPDVLLHKDGAWKVIDYQSGKLLVQRSIKTEELPDPPEQVEDFVKINAPSDLVDFKPMDSLTLKKGDQISLDGEHWLTLDKKYGHGLFYGYLNEDGNKVLVPNSPATTALHKKGVPVAKPVDIPAAPPPDVDDDAVALKKEFLDLVQKMPGIDEKAVMTVNNVIVGDYITVKDWYDNQYSGTVTNETATQLPGGKTSQQISLHTADGDVVITVPGDWPMIHHGVLEEGEPAVPLTLAQWAGVGIEEGQYIYPYNAGSGSPTKILGFGPTGMLQAQESNGNVMSLWTLDEMQNGEGNNSYYLNISKTPPPDIDYPPVAEAPALPKNKDDTGTKTAMTLWDGLPASVVKPTNTSVYYDDVNWLFVWQNSDGFMTTVSAIDPTAPPKVDTVKMSKYDWDGLTSYMAPISTPQPSTIKHSQYPTMEFEVIPDHYMVELGGAMWAVPKGGMDKPETWMHVGTVDQSGHSGTLPNLLTAQADLSTAKTVVDLNAPSVPEPPKVEQAAPKIPDTWPEWSQQAAAKVAEKYPGSRILLTDNGNLWVEQAPDEWHFLMNGSSANLTSYSSSEADIGDAKVEIWDPKQAPVETTATFNGKQFGPDAVVIKPTNGASYYYYKETPASEWHIIYASGGDYLCDSGDIPPGSTVPEGETVWPPGFEMEKQPVEPHVLGGESTVVPSLTTEKDPVITSGTGVWIKTLYSNNGSATYYQMDNDLVTVWTKEAGSNDLELYDHSPMNGKSPKEMWPDIVKFLPSSNIHTDVTPGNFQEPTADKPAKPWDDVVVDTVNPAHNGYAGLGWTDPETLKGTVPEGWTPGDWELALQYSTGQNTKIIVLTGTDDAGKVHAQLFQVTPSGMVYTFPLGPKILPFGPSGTDMQGGFHTAIAEYADQNIPWELHDISAVGPVNHLIGYKPGKTKTPANQWNVPISPTWQVFDISDNYGSLYRDDDGKWWLVAPTGVTTPWADDDDSAINQVKKYGLSLTEHVKDTDNKAPDAEPANVPGANNKSPKSTYYPMGDGTEIYLSVGDELFKHPNGSVYLWKSPDGTWWYQNAGEKNEFKWPDGMDLPPDFYTEAIVPVDLGESPPQPAPPTSIPAHPSAKSVPDPSIGDPAAILSKPSMTVSDLDQSMIMPGSWIAFQFPGGSDPEQIYWGMASGKSHYSGGPEVQVYKYENDEWVVINDSFGLSDSHPLWPVGYPTAGIPVKQSTPSIPTPSVSTAPGVPSVPTYPGSSKPTPEDIQSWGGALTKDGYIPSNGMMVKGKGPMHGKVISHSKDKTKAVVLLEDGTKTTRLISALTVDHAGNYTKYGTVTLPDAPAGQYLQVQSMEEGIDYLLKQPGGPKLGQLVGVMVGGTQDSTMHMRVANGPDGKPVIRIYTRLERSQAKNLEGILTNPVAPTPGAWVGNAKPSGDVAVGDEIAMRFGTTNQKWKPDADGTVPTHKVTKVEPGAGDVVTVTMENKTTGEVITSNFHTGPGKTIFTQTWDPNKIPPVQPGSVVTAPGWTKKPGRNVSAISVDGDWHPDKMGLLNNNYGSSGANTYVFKGADGSVIEATVPTSNTIRSTDGFTAITVPTGGDGAETSKRIAAAMQQLGVSGHPPNQAELKAKVAQHLAQYVQFDFATLGKQVAEKDVEAKAQAAFKEFGKIVGINDIGWQDVLIGQDGGGTSQFYWSDRVIAAIESKQKNKIMVKSNKTATADRIVSFLTRGVIPGAVRVTEMAANNTSASSDDQNQSTHGGFFSVFRDDKFPKGNPFWSDGSSTIYVNPMAALIRIGDMRANEYDVFGKPTLDGYGQCPSPCGANAKKLIDGNKHQRTSSGWTGLMDVMPAGGVAPEDIVFIGLDSPSERNKALQILKDSGVTHWGGRPVEEIIRLRSDIVKMKPSQVVPPVKRPDNAIPILSVPVVITDAAPAGEAAAAAVAVAAVEAVTGDEVAA